MEAFWLLNNRTETAAEGDGVAVVNSDRPEGSALEAQGSKVTPSSSNGAGEHAEPLISSRSQVGKAKFRTDFKQVLFANRHWFRLLLPASTLFWTSMLILPVLFDYRCGQSPPFLSMVLFGAMNLLNIGLELWMLWKSDISFKQYYMMLLLGTVFSSLGRYDMFADVTGLAILSKCETITWFSIEGHVFNLPVSLAVLMGLGLLVGVLLLQMLPGLILLLEFSWLELRKKDFCHGRLGSLEDVDPVMVSTALKFNEFCVLLEFAEKNVPVEQDYEDV